MKTALSRMSGVSSSNYGNCDMALWFLFMTNSKRLMKVVIQHTPLNFSYSKLQTVGQCIKHNFVKLKRTLGNMYYSCFELKTNIKEKKLLWYLIIHASKGWKIVILQILE